MIKIIPKPKWIEQEKVVKWILEMRRDAILREMGLEESPPMVYQVGQFTIVDEGDIYSVLEQDPEPSDEEKAVEAAMRGKTNHLADLLIAEANEQEATQHLPACEDYADKYAGEGTRVDSEHTIAPTVRRRLSPATLRLAAEFVSGKRNLKTGRDKFADKKYPGGGGRPPLGKEERAARTPTHNAGKYILPAIKKVLRKEYPGLTAKDYYDCALSIVEPMTGVKGNAVDRHLNKKSKRKGQRF
jgi:hypothetical protein